MENLNEIGDRVLTIQRTFNAPRKLVWEAWTAADHIAAWWGPKGINTRVSEHDFRPGGKWEYIMSGPDGSDFYSNGVFTEIEEFSKVVTSADFGTVTKDVVMVILFEDEGDQTRLTLNVVHPTPEYREAQAKMGFEHGWGAHLNSLENYLAARINS